MIFSVGLIIFSGLSNMAWGQTTLAEWNFPNNPDNAICDGGIAANAAKTITTVGGTSAIDFNQSGATTNCANATSWASGSGTKYWYINIVTTGYYNITVSSAQRGTTTRSARDFRLEYNIGAGWIVVSGGSITVANDFTTGVLDNLALPVACDNRASLQLRWIMTSNTSINGSTVNAAGTNRIDDIIISGNPPGLTVTPTTLDFGFVASGSTSSNMTYTLSGAGLFPSAGNINVAAPANFEVSLSSGSGFASSINVPFSSSILAATTIYVRFSPTSPGTNYSGNITNSGGGSAVRNVVVSGNSIVTYCTSNGNTTYQTSITYVNFNTISNTSAKPSGYSDYTSQVADVVKGSSYNLTVNLNTDGNYTIYAMAWIDWNGNGSFNDAGESYDLGSAVNTANGPTSLSPLSISVPAGAVTGAVRMRVSARYNAYPASCDTGFDGEVEDYTVNILPPSLIYYSRNANPTLLSSWNTNRAGGGSSPTSFTANNQTFIIQPSFSMTASAAWSVSGSNTKVEVESTASLTANAAITLSAATTFQLDNGATYNHNVSSVTVWSGVEIIDPGSTVVYGFAGAQNVSAQAYGNITVSGGNTKTMQGSISVAGILSLNNGNLSLGSGAYDLTLGTGATITTSGSFNNTHMIVCDGSGSLIKLGTAASAFAVVYPLGTGTNYTPFEITALTATVTGTGSISIRAVAGTAPGPPAAASTDLMKYWSTSSVGISGISSNIRLTYINPGEVGTGGDQTKYVPFIYTGGAWTQPSFYSAAGINPMTVSGTTTLSGQWTAREEPVYGTYYSYQSGAWNTAGTWTKDPSGTLSVSPGIPSITDRVVILNGRTVSTTANGVNVLSVQINDGGILDLGTFTTQNFTVIRGKGLVRLQTGIFPSGDWSNFVAEDGGTVEYYNTSNFTFSQTTYNNLIINLSTTAIVATLTGNMTINANLTITGGKFQINDATATGRNITVAGNIDIRANGSIGIGTGNANHRLTVKGDFINDGLVRMTNQATPSYTTTPTNGRSDLVFNNPNANQSLTCNGQSDFYRIEIDKGIDQTYILNIDASNNTNFKLFGRSDQQTSPPASDPPAIENPNALGLLAGTVRLGPNIVLPSLSSDAVYNIDLDAQLWLDGSDVTFSAAASNSSIVVYGNLRVSNVATLNANGGQGIVMRDQSALLIESGVVTTACIRTSYISGAHRGAFIMSGGTLNIQGNTLNLTGLNIYASFTLPYPDNVFRMTGGIINIISPTTITGGSGSNFSLLLGSSSNNFYVTGGTINITVPTNRNAYINTTSPLWDLNFISTSTTYKGQIQAYAGNASPAIPAITAQPLIIYNDLNILNNAVFNANGSNVTIGHSFDINTGAGYECGDNTTTFNGLAGQRLTNAGTVNNGTGLYNLTIADSSNTDVFSNNLIIRRDLVISNGSILNDVGHSITVAGNITNSGSHTSQASGAIILNGTTAQTISGSGKGVFGNLSVNKVSGTTTLTANQSVTGNLRLANGLIDAGTFNLSLGSSSNIYDALTGTTANFSATKMIRLAGNSSDGGVTKTYGSTTAFLFPIGTAADYTPATIQFTAAPAQWGSVTVRPVAQVHPLLTSALALTYYWSVTSSGFTGVPAGSVSHTYQYVTSDIVGTESNYIPGSYRPYAWTPIIDNSKVVDATNTILFGPVNYINGDYTAGETPAFQSIKVFYSRETGNWNNTATWSSIGVGGAIDGAIPGAGNPVVIGDNTNNHIVTVPVGVNNITVGGLQINKGSTLDLQTTTGHNFGAIPDTRVTGTGRLRISSSGASAVFPGGDFGNFLSKGGGIVEYYSTTTMGAATFTLPTTYLSGASTINLTGYNNLVTSPATAKNIILPNINQAVYDDFTVSGSGISQMNILAATRIVTIDSNLVVQSGTLRYMNGNNTAQSLIVSGDVIINNGAVFDVNTTGSATNLLTIYGSLTNNGTFDMNTGATQVCNVTFAGNINKEINGTGATTDFNILEVNKGSSRNTVLEVKSSVLTINTSLSTALLLTNGTFRLTSPIILNLTNAGSFTIPMTGSLSANGGTINIGGAAATNSTDLILAGRLEVIAGVINIGTAGNNLNNDIEYSSGGSPEIMVSGGTLYVNGQIRRVTTINTGSLSYTQSNNASVVTVAGRNPNNARAVFEILNSGSKFRMSGGTLNITGSFNSTDYFDFYLVPDSSTVTGGSIVFGSSVTTVNTLFQMATSAELYNLVIDATSGSKTLDLKIYPLLLKNNLTINGNTVFRANGLNVTLGGSLTNGNSLSGTGLTTGGYQPGNTNQVTIFNGAVLSTINGTGSNLTNFAHLTIDSEGTLLLSSNSTIRISSNLIIGSGYLDDGGNNIFLMGNVINNAAHASSIAGGGIRLEGSQPQVISGSGQGIFGNIIINNTTGISIVDRITINGLLTFTSGAIYLDDYPLTLGVNASIGGVTDQSRMIILNGVISDAGVTKIFPSGASAFTFPVGVAGKYTPVSYNFSSNPNSGASITVEPVNYIHPLMDLPTGDELKYYWNIVSEGFVSAYTVDQSYLYFAADVTGVEAEYVTGRFVAGNWSPMGGIAESSVNPVTHRITLLAKNYIDGEYTAGKNVNFSNTFTMYSIKTGNWFGDNTWSVSDGGPPCGFDPNGNIVVIKPGHVVTLNNNSAYAYSVALNGTLDAALTIYHNLGHVSGNGTLKLTSTSAGIFVFSGGDFGDFVNTSGSTVEFFGNNQASLPAKPGNIYKPYQNVILSGTGKKTIPSEDLKILGNITIQDPSTVLSNELYNKKIILSGSWIDNNTSATGGFIPGKGLVLFNGTSPELITITGGAVTESFYDLEIDNITGLTLSGAGKVNITDKLTLTNGIISTSVVNLLSISNTAENVINGGSVNSFVSGPLQKRILGGGRFTFPVGDASGLRYGQLILTDASVTGNYLAHYYNHNPLIDGYDPANVTAPIDVVSSSEYWRVNGPAPSTANITLRWDDRSGIIPVDAATRTKLRVVEWNPSWINRGNGKITGTALSGTIITSPVVSLSGDHRFSLGVESLPTATITSGAAGICNDGSTTNISISLTGTAPWTIRYKINGSSETTITNIGTSPYTLVVSNAMPALASGGPGLYSFTVSYIRDATGTTGIRDFTTAADITLYASPTPVISGLTTTPANSVVTYSTPAVSGVTFLWSVTGGVIQSGQGTRSITVLWGSGPAGSITLTETVTLGGCIGTTPPYNVSITDIPNPLVTGNTSVCLGSVETYSTPLVGTHTYAWVVTRGTFTLGATNNIINVTWTSTGAGSVRVTETGSSSVINTLPVTVSPVPPNNNTVSDPTTCINVPVNIIISAAPAGITYQLRLNSDNSPVGPPVSSMAGGDVSIPVTPAATTTYNIWALNEYSCGVMLTDLAVVTVMNDQIWTGAVGTDWNLAGNWSCGIVPTQTLSVQIPDVMNKPVLSSGANGVVSNIVIDIGASLTITGNTLTISGTITSNGGLNASAGTVEMNGTIAQQIGSGVFSGNTIQGLIINNAAGVTLQGPLNVTGVVYVPIGTLSSGGNLTLASTAAGTALIDGSGAGTVAGNVTMQRYLDPGFGYKYFSSPFQASTVSEFGDDMNLAYSFPLLYRFDENSPYSGWIGYVTGTNILNPMEGYAVNFGELTDPKTVDVTGVVNNGSLSVTLFNHDSVFTTGFNLVGNPYPSPVDWDGPGWTKTNIDDALYFFMASTTDQYGGTYSSYVNGVPSVDGFASNIIPSMQGFFVHVSDLTYPVTGTLGVSNSSRINNLTRPFLKSARLNNYRFLVRATASFTDDQTSADPLVIYFDNNAEKEFDGAYDALKLFNTDMMVTNFFSVLPSQQKLSINALPEQLDTAIYIPLGLTVYRDGEVSFTIRDVENLPVGQSIWFRDAVTGANVDMLRNNEYKVILTQGEYHGRFILAFIKSTTGIPETEESGDIFSAYLSGGIVKATVGFVDGSEGMINVYDVAGRPVYSMKVYEPGQYDLTMALRQGVYIIRYKTGTQQRNIKMVLGI